MVKSLNLYPHFVSLQLFFGCQPCPKIFLNHTGIPSLGENLGSHLGSLEVVFAFQDTEAGGTMGCVVPVRLQLFVKDPRWRWELFFFNWEIQGGRWWGVVYPHHQNHEMFFLLLRWCCFCLTKIIKKLQYTEERHDMTRKLPDIQNVCYQIPGVACRGKEDAWVLALFFLLHDWHESNLGLNDCPVHFVCVSNVRSSPHLGRLQFLQLSSSFFCLPMFCLFLLQERMVQTTCTSMQWRKVMICDKCKPQKILSMASTLCTVFKENAAGWSGDSIPLYRSHGPCW